MAHSDKAGGIRFHIFPLEKSGLNMFHRLSMEALSTQKISVEMV